MITNVRRGGLAGLLATLLRKLFVWRRVLTPTGRLRKIALVDAVGRGCTLVAYVLAFFHQLRGLRTELFQPFFGFGQLF